MPDLPLSTKISGLENVIDAYRKLADTGRKPGIGVYAENRLPRLERALQVKKAQRDKHGILLYDVS